MSIFSVKIGRKNIEFHDNYLMIGSEKIGFESIEGISYLLTQRKQSVYFLPVFTSSAFDIRIKTKERVYKIRDSWTDLMNFETKRRKQTQDHFSKLVHVLNVLIKPRIVNLLLQDISNRGFTNIGKLKITRNALERSRWFRSPDVMPLNQYFNSQLQGGSLWVYRNVNEKPRGFFDCQMSEMNSVVIPDLLLSLAKAG